jgi:large subunit ribosomal protein L10
MLTKDQKKNYIAEMTTQFENSKAVMVTHYQGLTMTQLDELRAKMREHGIIFKITKNRITKLALEKLSVKIYQIYLQVQLQLHLVKTL